MKKYLLTVLPLLLVLVVMLAASGCAGSAGQESGQEATESEASEQTAGPDLDGILENIHVREDFRPAVGIVLGSGLSPLAEEIDVVDRISYADIPGFPHSTVAGHKGEYIFGYLEGVPVVVMNGRVHYYEGYTMEEVVTPDRIMAKLGAKTVILTNAVGSLQEDLPPGTLVCVEDHIASFIPNPLIGPNDEDLGERFVDMTNAYDGDLRQLLHETAEEEGIGLKDGVFCQVTGPTYETKAEAELYAAAGADTIGMSTACETIALRHMGVRVLCINCVTNYCPNCSEEGISHEEVQKAAEQAGADMIRLVKGTVKKIGEE